jgi:hypothetical protein
MAQQAKFEGFKVHQKKDRDFPGYSFSPDTHFGVSMTMLVRGQEYDVAATIRRGTTGAFDVSILRPGYGLVNAQMKGRIHTIRHEFSERLAASERMAA